MPEMQLPARELEICAVITTYRPDEGLSFRVERVRRQVGRVVIVDDGALQANVRELHSWFDGVPNVLIYHNPQNIGLAATLNVGVSIVREQGFRWVLTLDDDTLVYPTMVERLLANLRQVDGKKPVGLAGMSWVEIGIPRPISTSPQNVLWEEKRGIITSGSLFSMDAYDDIGPFREDYIIGAIDYEYCLRARAKGYRVIRFTEVGFEQRLGRLSLRRVGSFTVKTYNYNAARYYYGFRNNVMNIRANLFRDPAYCLAVLVNSARMMAVVTLFETDGRRKARAMLRGAWHGITNQMGKMTLDE